MKIFIRERLLHFARLAQKVLKIPFQDTSGRNVLQPLGYQLFEHAKFFRLLKQIGDGRLPHFFREKIERRRGFFGRRHGLTVARPVAQPKSLLLALPEQPELRGIARRLGEPEVAEGVRGQEPARDPAQFGLFGQSEEE